MSGVGCTVLGMGYTIKQVRDSLEMSLSRTDGSEGYAREYLYAPLMMRHFKAGCNRAWQESRGDIDAEEDRYAEKHGVIAGQAFYDGWIYSVSYMG